MKRNKIIFIESPSDFKKLNLSSTPDHGLVAFSNKLTPQLIIAAYEHGIFPWFNEDEPILWWSPNPRQILNINNLHTSRSLKKIIKKNIFKFNINNQFNQVIDLCIDLCRIVKRKNQNGTWIDNRIIRAYSDLHQTGYAHSFELYDDNELIAGVYGLIIKNIFFGESMFHLKTNASKICFFYMCQFLKKQGIQIIDTQVESEHIKKWGGTLVTREEFLAIINS